MSEQLPLFDAVEPTWAQRLRRRLDPQRRDRVKAILVEMAQVALRRPPAGRQEVDPDEH